MKDKTLAGLGLAGRLVAGAVLIYAGATKAAGPAEEFALVIDSYQFLPPDAVQSAAVFLPWAELLFGWALLLGFLLRAAAAASGALFAAFLMGLLWVKSKGIDLPNCGCFGDAVHLTTVQALTLDSLLLALCFAAWRSAPSRLSLDSWAAGSYTGRHVR